MIDAAAKYVLKLQPKWLETGKASPNKPAVVLSQRFGLSRNLKKYPFLKIATALEKDAIFSEVAEAVKKTNLFGIEKFIKINLKECNFLFENLLFEKDILPYSVLDNDWTQGVLADGAEKFPTILINTKNHLDIFADAAFGEEAEALAKLNEVDNILGEELLFGYNPDIGFLMANPEECGSGLFMETVAHLPALVLTEEINEVLNGISIMGARAEGVQNSGTTAWGAFFKITANFSDMNEKELIAKTKEIQNALLVAETKARKRLFKEARIVMEDKIYRCLGIMQHARIMSISQLFNFISLLRLGSEYKVFPVGMRTLNALFKHGWTANIIMIREITGDTDIDEERATMYRSLLSSIDEL